MNEQSVEYVLKNFPGTRYYPEFRLTTWHPQGTFDAALANKIIAFIEWEEYIQDAPFDRYTDLSGIAEIRIGIGSMIEIARRRRFVQRTSEVGALWPRSGQARGRTKLRTSDARRDNDPGAQLQRSQGSC